MNAPIRAEDIPHIVRLRKETGLSWPAIAQRYGRPPSHGPTFAHAVARSLGPKTTPRAGTKRLRALEEQSTPAVSAPPRTVNNRAQFDSPGSKDGVKFCWAEHRLIRLMGSIPFATQATARAPVRKVVGACPKKRR